MIMLAIDAELVKAQYAFWGAVASGSATLVAAIIAGFFGTVITRKYSREKDRQEKESQWRNHAIELTKLDLQRKLKRFEIDNKTPLRPSILDFLANYRDLLDLDKVAPKALYLNIREKRVNQLGAAKAEQEEAV